MKTIDAIKDIYFALGDNGPVLVSGAIGSVVAAVTHDGNTKAKIRIVVVGSLSCVFLHPLFIPFISPVFGVIGAPEGGVLPLSGFGAGAFGIVIFETIREAIRNRARDLANGKIDLGRDKADNGDGDQ